MCLCTTSLLLPVRRTSFGRKFGFRLPVFILVIASSLAALPTLAQDSDTYFNLGLLCEQKKDWPKAIRAFNQAIEMNPKFADAYVEQGHCYTALGQFDNAHADFATALTLNPDLPGAHYARAEIDIKTRDYAEAIADYTQYLKLEPKPEPSAYFKRGNSYSGQQDNVRAAADFQTYTVQAPVDPEGWNSLGIALGRQGDWKGAIAAFTKYLSLNPPDNKAVLEAIKDRGICEYNIKDFAAANVDLEKYSAAYPDDPLVRKIACDTVSPSEAINRWKKVLAQNPKDDDAANNLGGAYLNAKQYPEAVSAFTTALDLKRDAWTLYSRGLAYYDEGIAGTATAFAKATADAAAALALKPDFSVATLLKADSEFADKQYAEAMNDYRAYGSLPDATAENKKHASDQMLLCTSR